MSMIVIATQVGKGKVYVLCRVTQFVFPFLAYVPMILNLQWGPVLVLMPLFDIG